VVSPVVFDDPNRLFEAPATLATEVQETLLEMQRDHGFYAALSDYRNLLGLQEKWFLDRQGAWYLLTPDGNLHGWVNGRIEFLSALDSLVYDDPNRLFGAAVMLSEALQEALGGLQKTYGFHAGPSYYHNYLGLQEKWFLDRNGAWHVITPDGTVYLWLGQRSTTSIQQIAVLDPLVFDDPTRLFEAPVILPAEAHAQLVNLQQIFGFRFDSSFRTDSVGLGEKWFRDRYDVWYVLLPSGLLLRWDGTSVQTSTAIAIVDVAVFDNPFLLFDA
jgi:hypothetical protein